jgi:hypothetical protein
VLQKDTGIVQSGYEVLAKERILLKILGSVSIGSHYYGKLSYAKGVLKIGGVSKSHGPQFERKAFSLFIK